MMRRPVYAGQFYPASASPPLAVIKKLEELNFRLPGSKEG